MANASVFLKNKTRGIETYQEKKNREPIKKQQKKKPKITWVVLKMLKKSYTMHIKKKQSLLANDINDK